MTLIFVLFGEPICSIFSTDPEVIKEASLCLMVICLGNVFFSYQMIVTQAFNGAGDTTTPTILSFIFMWLVQIPLSYTLAVSLNMGSLGVYIAIGISSLLIALAAIFLFRRGKWKNVVV